jgi:hypothetical protein
MKRRSSPHGGYESEPVNVTTETAALRCIKNTRTTPRRTRNDDAKKNKNTPRE